MIMNIFNLVKFYKIGGHFVFGFIKKVHFLRFSFYQKLTTGSPNNSLGHIPEMELK